MLDRKTTITGFIGSAVSLVALFGFEVDPKLVVAFQSVVLAIVSFLAKDKTE